MTVTVLREATKRNGYVIEHMAVVDARSVTTTISDLEKVELSDGKLAVDWVSNSYKYGSEVQLVYYTRQKPEIRQRVDGHNGYYRVEIHLSPDEAAKVVKALQ